MSGIAERLAALRERIAAAEKQAARAPGSVRLVAASKAQPASAVLEAARAGQRLFGENYAREMREKRLELATSLVNIEWHFIGRVQRSNAKEITSASLVHGVGSLEQLEALVKREKVPLLLQVSLWDEATKNGFTSDELERILPVLLERGDVDVRGFMAMPPPEADARAAFAKVRELRDRLAPQLQELSMGMSSDFEDAIREGATLVRVGTALFGARPVAS
jgi:pyridoxal phosphate enzyme (YggS family)